jgi:hypothetical protein
MTTTTTTTTTKTGNRKAIKNFICKHLPAVRRLGDGDIDETLGSADNIAVAVLGNEEGNWTVKLGTTDENTFSPTVLSPDELEGVIGNADDNGELVTVERHGDIEAEELIRSSSDSASSFDSTSSPDPEPEFSSIVLDIGKLGVIDIFVNNLLFATVLKIGTDLRIEILGVEDVVDVKQR